LHPLTLPLHARGGIRDHRVVVRKVRDQLQLAAMHETSPLSLRTGTSRRREISGVRRPGRFGASRVKARHYAVVVLDSDPGRKHVRLTAAFAIAALGLAASISSAFAETWTLIVQPAPYSQSPPSYDSWIAYQPYGDLQTCLDMRMKLHYELWESDRDLSMRALAGVCRSDSTGQIVKEYQDGDDEEW
jgi:hypothetical protein